MAIGCCCVLLLLLQGWESSSGTRESCTRTPRRQGHGCLLRLPESSVPDSSVPGVQVRGYGLSADGHHITHPHPNGLGALTCMHRALAGSGLAARHLAYINAHATSTPTGKAWGYALTACAQACIGMPKHPGKRHCFPIPGV